MYNPPTVTTATAAPRSLIETSPFSCNWAARLLQLLEKLDETFAIRFVCNRFIKSVIRLPLPKP